MRLPDIARAVRLEHPAASVWTALTDPDALAAWLMPNDFRPVEGHRFAFRTDPAPGFDGTVEAEVLRLVPERLLELAWRGGGADTVVRFELEPDGPDATVLHLRQSGFAHGDLLSRLVLGAGWRRRVLPALGAHLSRSPRPRRPTP